MGTLLAPSYRLFGLRINGGRYCAYVPNVNFAGVSIVIHRLTLATALATVGGYAYSQPTDSPMERSEPHEALAFFEGTWTVPGKDDWRETCSWLAGGRRHIVCAPRWRFPNMTFEGLSVFSYDEKSGEYLAHRFKAFGRVSTETRPAHSPRLSLHERARLRCRPSSGAFHPRGSRDRSRQYRLGNGEG